MGPKNLLKTWNRRQNQVLALKSWLQNMLKNDSEIAPIVGFFLVNLSTIVANSIVPSRTA